MVTTDTSYQQHDTTLAPQRSPLVSLRPAPSHYFPSLHQLKYEVEDGVTPNSRPVRFGFEPRVFPGFSWRGYAVLSPAQVGVVLTF